MSRCLRLVSPRIESKSDLTWISLTFEPTLLDRIQPFGCSDRQSRPSKRLTRWYYRDFGLLRSSEFQASYGASMRSVFETATATLNLLSSRRSTAGRFGLLSRAGYLCR